MIEIIFKSIFDSAVKARNAINILDIGCGTGSRLEEMRKYRDVVGIDISKEALGYAQIKGCPKFIRADAQSLPIKAENWMLCYF